MTRSHCHVQAYTADKLRSLLQMLRSEAFNILLFLKSVHSIEVRMDPSL